MRVAWEVMSAPLISLLRVNRRAPRPRAGTPAARSRAAAGAPSTRGAGPRRPAGGRGRPRRSRSPRTAPGRSRSRSKRQATRSRRWGNCSLTSWRDDGMDGLQAQDGPGDGPRGSNSRVSYGFTPSRGIRNRVSSSTGFTSTVSTRCAAAAAGPARRPRWNGRRRHRRSCGNRRRPSREPRPARPPRRRPSARRGPSRRRPRRGAGRPTSASPSAGTRGRRAISCPTSSTAWPLAFQSTSGPSMSACSARRAASSAGAPARGRRRGGTRASPPSRPRRTHPWFPGTRTRSGCGRAARSRAARSLRGRGRRWPDPSCGPSVPPPGPPGRPAPPRARATISSTVCAATVDGTARATREIGTVRSWHSPRHRPRRRPLGSAGGRTRSRGGGPAPGGAAGGAPGLLGVGGRGGVWGLGGRVRLGPRGGPRGWRSRASSAAGSRVRLGLGLGPPPRTARAPRPVALVLVHRPSFHVAERRSRAGRRVTRPARGELAEGRARAASASQPSTSRASRPAASSAVERCRLPSARSAVIRSSA